VLHSINGHSVAYPSLNDVCLCGIIVVFIVVNAINVRALAGFGVLVVKGISKALKKMSGCANSQICSLTLT
jgi:hypothetical protein